MSEPDRPMHQAVGGTWCRAGGIHTLSLVIEKEGSLRLEVADSVNRTIITLWYELVRVDGPSYHVSAVVKEIREGLAVKNIAPNPSSSASMLGAELEIGQRVAFSFTRLETEGEPQLVLCRHGLGPDGSTQNVRATLAPVMAPLRFA